MAILNREPLQRNISKARLTLGDGRDPPKSPSDDDEAPPDAPVGDIKAAAAERLSPKLSKFDILIGYPTAL